jgi:hypothetical protein
VDRRDLAATATGLVVGLAVLLALAEVTGGRAVIDALAGAAPGLVTLVAAGILAWLCLWGLALRAVLSALGTRVSAVDAVLVNAAAAFANHVTPFGQAGGEPATALLLSDVGDTPFERALGAITSFDVLNVVASLSLASIGVAYHASVAAVAGTDCVVAPATNEQRGIARRLDPVEGFAVAESPDDVASALRTVASPPSYANGIAAIAARIVDDLTPARTAPSPTVAD